MRLFLILCLPVFMMIAHRAHAECTLASLGEVRAAGTIIYNKKWRVPQLCHADGRWRALTPLPDPCTVENPGTVCEDASFYIGALDGGPRIYAAPADESETKQWKIEHGWTWSGFSATDGYSNTYADPALSNIIHPAGYACAMRRPVGTWYLPARDELKLMWDNRLSIDLPSKGIDVSGARYWSSTENSASFAMSLQFSDGASHNPHKIFSYLIRCVRH